MESNLIVSLLQKDKDLLVFLNSLGNEQWDSFWLLITNQFSWSPLFILIFYLVIKSNGWKRGGFIIFSMILLVAFSDQFVNLIKNSTARLRPNNDPEIQEILRTFIKPQSFCVWSRSHFNIFCCIYHSCVESKIQVYLFDYLLSTTFRLQQIVFGSSFPNRCLIRNAFGGIIGPRLLLFVS